LSDVVLSETDQAALRFVLAAEPLAGHSLPPCGVLQRLAALVRCDAIGAALTDPNGYVVDEVGLPEGATLNGSGCGAPLRIGMAHSTRVQGDGQRIQADGLSDSLAVGFRTSRDRVVQVW